MLSMFHEPSRTYIDPWTGQLFGEGGVEGSVAAARVQAGKHFGFGAPGVKNAKGGVIMPKLGNETAKYVPGSSATLLASSLTPRDHCIEQNSDEQPGN